MARQPAPRVAERPEGNSSARTKQARPALPRSTRPRQRRVARDNSRSRTGQRNDGRDFDQLQQPVSAGRNVFRLHPAANRQERVLHARSRRALFVDESIGSGLYGF